MRAMFTVEQLGRLGPNITIKSLQEQWKSFSRPRPRPYTRDQFFEAMEKETYLEVEDFFGHYQEDSIVKELLGDWRSRRW